MFGWSINLFRIAGIRLSLHWSFLLLLIWAALEGARLEGLAGAGWMTVFMVLVFTCIVLHELGHSFVARRFGVGVSRILLLPIGGMAEFDWIPRRPMQEVAIAIAGPAANLFLVLLLWVAGVRFPADWTLPVMPLSWADLGRYLLVLNVVMACFNLIPVFPMDGGRILRALLALRLPYVRATLIAASVAKVLATIALAVLLLGLDEPNWLGALLFVFIVVAGELEYRSVLRREQEEAHWEQLLARFYAEPPRLVESTPTRVIAED